MLKQHGGNETGLVLGVNVDADTGANSPHVHGRARGGEPSVCAAVCL